MTAAHKKRGATAHHRPRVIWSLTAPAWHLAKAYTESKTQRMGSLEKDLKAQFAAIGQAFWINPGERGQILHALSESNSVERFNHERRIIARLINTGVQEQRLFLGSVEAADDIPPDEIEGHNFTSSGVCVLSHSTSTTFIRVCQPGPDALNCSNTLGSNRIVVRGFTTSALGLPRRTSRAPLNSSARLKKASVSSGASSGSTQTASVLGLFALIGFPHRDDTASLAARGPDHYNHPTYQQAHGDKADLSVFLSCVLGGEVVTGKDGSSVGKIHAPFGQGFVTLGRIEGYLHGFIVCTLIKACNYPRFPTIAKHSRSRYGSPVAAKSATGFSSPTTQRPHTRPISIAGAFFTPAISFYGGCAWGTFECAGVLCARSANPRTVATLIRLAAIRGGSPHKGAVPMPTLNPSALRALAHRRMALSALRADSSLSVRLKRYNAHMAIVRTLETVGGAA